MIKLRSVLLGLFLVLASFTGAWAQCGTQAPANKFCGNDTGVTALANWKTIPAGALTPIAGGTVLGNPTGALAVPIATTAPVLGIPGTSTGQVGLAGLTSGTAVLRAQSVAGSAVSLLPTAAGTLVGTAVAPLAINATAPSAGVTGLAGGVLAGAGATFTMTPALGAAGVTTGSIAFNAFTSGSVVISPQSVAGTPTLLFPNTSGTFAVNASSPVVLSATTGGLTCPTCVTSSGGGAITGTAPISVSAAGVVSITSPLPLTNGGTNASLTASNGGIVWSNATQLQILAGTATARLPVLSGATATPVFGAYTLPASVTSGGIPFFSSTTVEGSSALLTASAIMLGGGAGVAPSTLGSLGTTTTVLHGNAAGAPTFAAVVSADMNITTTSCTNQFVTAISAGGVGTCTTDTLASAQHANQGTTTTLLHGNAAGNPSFGQVVFADIASAALTTGAQLRSGTASTLVAADIIYDAGQTITFAGTQTWDFSTFLNARETLTANITSLTCSNIKASQSGTISLVQDGTGSRTMVAGWCSQFRWAGGTRGVLSTALNTIDALFYQCVTTAICYVSLSKGQVN